MGNMSSGAGGGGRAGGDGGAPWSSLEVTWEDFQLRRRALKDCGEDCGDELNGLELSGVIVPETVLEHILSFVRVEDILGCNAVCRAWKDVIVRKSFWKQFWDERRWDWNLVPRAVRDKPYGWIVLHAQLKHQIATRNFISNHSGEQRLQGWQIIRDGGDRWRVEREPLGCDPLPVDPFFGNFPSAFVSSFEWSSKAVIVDLWEMGLTPPVMAASLPFEIECSQMYTSRWDCGGMYKWAVQVLDPTREAIMEHEVSDSFLPMSEWKTLRYAFKFRPEHAEKMGEVRYVFFQHDGKDNQFWKGHFGTKFARACVQFRFTPDAPH